MKKDTIEILESIRSSLEEGGMGASPWKSAKDAYISGAKAVDNMSPNNKQRAHSEAVKATQKLKSLLNKKVEKMLYDGHHRGDAKVKDIVDDLYHLWYYAGMQDQSK